MAHAVPAESTGHAGRNRPRLRWRILRLLLIAGIWAALALGAALLWLTRDLPGPRPPSTPRGGLG